MVLLSFDAALFLALMEVSQKLAVMLMAAKAGVPVCPHAGGVGLCELVIHLSLIDFISISGSIDVNAFLS